MPHVSAGYAYADPGSGVNRSLRRAESRSPVARAKAAVARGDFLAVARHTRDVLHGHPLNAATWRCLAHAEYRCGSPEAALSTAHLFRQTRPGDWRSVVEAVASRYRPCWQRTSTELLWSCRHTARQFP